MADMNDACCSTQAEATCCDADAKGACCGQDTAGACRCPDGAHPAAPAPHDVREAVRERYAAAARTAGGGGGNVGGDNGGRDGDGDGGGDGEVTLTDEHGTAVFGATLYGDEQDGVAQDALAASLGCGVPTAVADLCEGETVLDLGSGAGADVLISASRVGPRGKAIGLDMTDEMLELARRNAAQAGATNIEFRKGYIEEIPLPDASVDVVISNCVINLSADKPRVLREVARVLRPGGRFAVSDVIADDALDEATQADMRQWTGCIAGALTRADYESALRAAGLQDIEIRETHRVHAHAAGAIIHARRPTQTATPTPPH